MLLQRIKLRGFLGHLGVRSATNGKADWVEVDFSSSPLWLVHGPNGGGKSSLWDAVTFALFKEHRIGGKNFDKLVHDRADKAEVAIEFDLQGNRFLIGAEIEVKGRKRTVKTSRIVRAWKGNDWATVADNERNVEEWLRQNLSLSFGTFTSAILLRQGEADKFLKAKPTECREVLTELLQLSFYRKLDVAATKHLNQKKEKLVECERRLEGLPNPTDDDLNRHFQVIAADEDVLTGLKAQVEQKRKELTEALRFENLSAEITAKQKQQQEYAAVIAEAANIEAAVRRYRNLNDGLRQLDKLWETKEVLKREAQAYQVMQTRFTATEEKLRETSARLATQRQGEVQAQENLAQAQVSWRAAQQRKAQATDQAKTVENIESLEAAIAREQETLHPYLAILAERERIEHEGQRFGELNQAIPLLENLARSATQLERAKLSLAAAESSVETQAYKFQQAESEEKACQEECERIANQINGIHEALNDCKNQLSVMRDKLNSRNNITGKEECPTCGEVLNDEKQQRVETQRNHFRQETTRLELETQNLSARLSENNTALREAQTQLELKKKFVQQLSNDAATARNNVEHARNSVEQIKQTHSEATAKAQHWAGQLDQLDGLRNELLQLRHSPHNVRQFNEANAARDKVEAATAAYQSQLNQLPTFGVDERQHIRAEAQNAEQAIISCEQNHQAAAAALLHTTQLRNESERIQSALQSAHQSEQEQLQDLQQRLSVAQQKHHQASAELTSEWASHPACEDQAVREALQQESKSLQAAEEREENLRHAQRNADQIAGAITALEEQLAGIPSEYRRQVSDVSKETQQIEHQQQTAEQRLRAAREKLTEMQRQQTEYKQHEVVREAATKEVTLYKKLAEKLGKQGLLSQIIQQAQEQITINANGILGRLSNGLWQVTLRNESENELQIEACDLMTGQTRPFLCLSGGEKFRVAVSLAVAIGQYVLGGHSVDTLIIDEGFGALDETNRDLLVKELSNLSDDVLRGGRVIVVSHQEDICDRFSSRYRIEKDAEGYIRIQSSLE